MMKQTNWRLAIFLAALLTFGCGKWPPVTNDKMDVLNLPVSTENIRARSLCDEDFASLSHLQQLRYLDLYGGWAVGPARFSDKGLASLASLNLPHLETIFFGHCTNITNASLTNIVKLKTVTFLGLVACPGITDTGLRTLDGMTNLRELDLRGCPNITDKGLEYLASETNWQRIEFGGCSQVTLGAVAILQHKLPNAHIKKDEEEWSHETK